MNFVDEKRGVYERKPMKCEACGKVCKGKGALTSHRKSHKGKDDIARVKVATLIAGSDNWEVVIAEIIECIKSDNKTMIPRKYWDEMQSRALTAQLQEIQTSIIRLKENEQHNRIRKIALEIREEKYINPEAIEKECTSIGKLDALVKRCDMATITNSERALMALGIKDKKSEGGMLVAELMEGLRMARVQRVGSEYGTSTSELIPNTPADREAVARSMEDMEPSLLRLADGSRIVG